MDTMTVMHMLVGNLMSEKTQGIIIIKNEQCRDTGHIGHKTQSEDQQNKKHNTEN